jgi:uncharacterized protein
MTNAMTNAATTCRVDCGACCIAPSISSPIPGMPHGKLAGVRCVQLTDDNRCAIFGKPARPAVCLSLRPTPEMCGVNNAEAFTILTAWEQLTEPSASDEAVNSYPSNDDCTKPR